MGPGRPEAGMSTSSGLVSSSYRVGKPDSHPVGDSDPAITATCTPKWQCLIGIDSYLFVGYLASISAPWVASKCHEKSPPRRRLALLLSIELPD
ncbi:unnamed protein product [Protopolystoma xenopodis]|uniref:Uncharacterized protein n=1 Tax=Protopolystoma xenopodis TaxID=117903 RepID=A0A3S4ZY86_9PLAT|nr:unnamed protein product [Protopolystoma xenopodis]